MKESYPFMKKYPLCLLLLCLASLCCGQDVEFCDYRLPMLRITRLPVFAENPRYMAEDTYPVFDVLVNEFGQPVGAYPVYSPNKEMSLCYLESLKFRNYIPANECGQNVASLVRDTAAAYFYVSSSEVQLTRLPVSTLVIDRFIYELGQDNMRKLNFTVKIDAEGRLLEAKSSRSEWREFCDSFLNSKKGQVLFLPAYSGETPVPCELKLHIGDTVNVPRKVLKLAEQKESESLFGSPVTETVEMQFKLHYNQYGVLTSIRLVGDQDLSFQKMAAVLKGLRYWSRESRGDCSSDVLVSLAVVPGEEEVRILDRQELVFQRPVMDDYTRPLVPYWDRGDKIMLTFDITEQGLTENVEVYVTTAKQLVEPCLRAARTWKFKPATYGGEPRRTRMTYTINFIDSQEMFGR